MRICGAAFDRLGSGGGGCSFGLGRLCGVFFDARDYDSLVWQGHVDGHVDDGLAGAC